MTLIHAERDSFARDFMRASNRRHLRLRVAELERLGRGPVLSVDDHDGGVAGPDLWCTLGSLWDVLGPEAPLYASVRDFAMRRLQPFGAALQRFAGRPEAPRPRGDYREP
jgi:hypothetical protein